jgi:hypothetical protein
MSGCLKDGNWKISYGPADDRLRDFYVPALSRAVSYDRTAGFFSSRSLAIAAAGVARLVRSGGKMRLLVGAQLEPEDVEAIEHGEEAFEKAVEARLLRALDEMVATPQETEVIRRRLEVLTWLVAAKRLDIRVVLPLGADGRPLPAAQARDYFHAKEGVFEDACGHQLAFAGSVNETTQGWERNYEQFAVYFSWDSTHAYLAQVVDRIGRLWAGTEEGWRALPIPQAVRDSLLERYPPCEPVARDPGPGHLPPDQRERILFAFLRDAPYLEGGGRMALRTAGVRPWPHQARVVEEVVDRFPERFLLADEVGLGKTIEAGLVLRTLLVPGSVSRCLVLVPKSVVRQWQEELYEKAALNVPSFDGREFADYFGRVRAPQGNPWDAFPVLLSSSQLAKRRERADDLLRAAPWDLVIVDEAHHARRRDILVRNRYRPNSLLTLLEGTEARPGLTSRTQGLLLLTATPMQLHPVELYDLLRQLDLPAVWAASEERFLRFLEELRAIRAGEGDWRILLRLARAGLADGVTADGADGAPVVPDLSDKLGPVAWEQVQAIFAGQRPADEARSLRPVERAALLEMCRRASPIGRRMFRATRETLRRYREAGLLKETIPERRPEPAWIAMSQAEWDLYLRVEKYVSSFYQRFENERKGLGFIMTVYRRRLTSSFAALRRSLERRRVHLLDRAGGSLWLTDEDTEDADLDEDVGEEIETLEAGGRLPPGVRRLVEQEVREIDGLLDVIGGLGEDTKFVRLVDDLSRVLGRRGTVAVFTHYADTMDALRDRLRGVYGRSLACYSGRGGERWDGKAWKPESKEDVKNAFRAGEVRVLLCTEAASEGLNLQTCGVLINYDMPWNPMRVEQRIGRFDRINQTYPDVWITHYFLLGPNGEETVEARVYRALADRIDWFRSVVGELAPILARISRTIERAAVAMGEEREAVLAEELAKIRGEIEAQSALVSLDDWAMDVSSPDGPAPPLDLGGLEQALRGSSLGARFAPHPRIAGAFLLDWAGQSHQVTFDLAVVDAHPGTLRLLTYGEPLLGEILEAAEEPAEYRAGAGFIRVRAAGLRRWFAAAPADAHPNVAGSGADTPGVPTRSNGLVPIHTLGEIEERLQASAEPVLEKHLDAARIAVTDMVAFAAARAAGVERSRATAQQDLLKERARKVMAEAAACVMIQHQFETREALQHLTSGGYPWAGLATLAGYPSPTEVDEALSDYMQADTQRPLDDLVAPATAVLSKLARANEADRHLPRAKAGADGDLPTSGVTTAEASLLGHK